MYDRYTVNEAFSPVLARIRTLVYQNCFCFAFCPIDGQLECTEDSAQNLQKFVDFLIKRIRRVCCQHEQLIIHICGVCDILQMDALSSCTGFKPRRSINAAR